MPLTPGTRLGPYEILAPIGAGGMGEVYKARDTRLDRLVAIKVSQAEFSERFEREARAVSALSHPNTCQLYDVGPNYLVMEFIEDSPLPTVENARKLLDLAVQTADGMAADHAAGIVHRDLKPDNILVTREGRDGQWISCIRQNNGQSKLANIRALPGASPVILADAEGVPATQRSQKADWILYSAGNSLDLISPDGKSRRKLSSRRFMAYNFSKDGGQVYGIFHSTTGTGPEWQLYKVDMTTGAEKPLSAVDLAPSTAALAGFSIHPDGKRALTSIAKWPFQIWMLEGFEQPRAKNWLSGAGGTAMIFPPNP